MNIPNLSRELIAIDSTPSHGNCDVVRFCADVARQHGLFVETFDEVYEGVPQTNIVIRPRAPEAECEDLILLSRLTTRDPGDYLKWTKTGANPFSASLDGDKIIGLGAADAKVDFVAKLAAVIAVKAKAFKGAQPCLVGSFGREDGAGAIKLLRHRRVRPKFAIIGGATENRIATRGPGYARIEILVPFSQEEIEYRKRHDLLEGSVTQSKMFHAPKADKVSDPLLDNPILKSLDYLQKLPAGVALMNIEGGSPTVMRPDFAMVELDFVDTISDSILQKLTRIAEAVKNLGLAIRGHRDASFHPPFSTVSVGCIRTRADHVSLLGSCRILPVAEEGPKQRQIFEDWLGQLSRDCVAAGAEYRLIDYKPPFLADRAHTFFGAVKAVCSELGFSNEDTAALECSEANVFHRLGIPTVVFGPGDLGDGHSTVNESVNLLAAEKAAVFYRSLIERMC